jgi:NitT/TauT family transport system substrate-binding protein
MTRDFHRRAALILFAGAVSFGLGAGAAQAADPQTIRVGKAIISSFPFAGLELGQQQGIWNANGLDAQVVTMSGDGKLQQAFAAKAIDFGVGSGPGMGYAAKGVPARAVAVMAYAPNNMGLFVSNASGIKTIDDLKGKAIGVTTAGALTDWLVRKIAVVKHWQPDDIQAVPLGDARTRYAAIEAGQLQGTVNAIQECRAAEERGQGKTLLTFGSVVPHFFTHVVYASDDMIKNHPDTVKSFLKAWFTVAAYMRDHRKETVASVAATMNIPPKIVDETYDIEIGMMSFDGHFDDEGMAVLRQSLKDLGILDHVPEASAIYTPQFIPVSIN